VRYIFYGAGAVGGTLGAYLFVSGFDVALIARGEHGRVLRERGLRFGTPAGWRTLPITAVEHPAELTLRADDVIVLSMKGPDTQAALDALSALAPADVAIVCAQNGVENERRALRQFPNVHGMWLMMAAVYTDPGTIHAHNTPVGGVCDIGRYPFGSDTVDAQIAADFETASLQCSVREDIMSRKYAKLQFNLMNVLEAACGRGGAAELLARARGEAGACYAAAGVVPFSGLDPRIEAMQTHPVPGVERGGGSTWQSLARGTPVLEADDLNGEIVLLGRLYGVPVPVNTYLQTLARRLVRERVLPGSLTAEAIESDFEAWLAEPARQ
jgi:2-dehydropantoate 2-reductase